MKKITCNGEKDHLFVDDRDLRIETLPKENRVPSYGSNDLVPPNRPLLPDEVKMANRVGMPVEGEKT